MKKICSKCGKTIEYNMIFFIPTLVIADKYNEDTGAIFARWIALIAKGVIIIGTILRFI